MRSTFILVATAMLIACGSMFPPEIVTGDPRSVTIMFTEYNWPVSQGLAFIVVR